MSAPGFPECPHGTRGRYSAGCRCRPCTAANARAYRERVARGRELAASIPRRADGYCAGFDGYPCPWTTKLRCERASLCHRCRERFAWNGVVDASRAREHLQRLSRSGVGYRQAADAACVSVGVVTKILHRPGKKIRKWTERAILSVDAGARADHALIDAAPTWRLIGELEPEYLTRAALARALGYATGRLQLGRRRITVRSAERVRRLHVRVFGDEAAR